MACDQGFRWSEISWYRKSPPPSGAPYWSAAGRSRSSGHLGAAHQSQWPPESVSRAARSSRARPPARGLPRPRVATGVLLRCEFAIPWRVDAAHLPIQGRVNRRTDGVPERARAESARHPLNRGSARAVGHLITRRAFGPRRAQAKSDPRCVGSVLAKQTNDLDVAIVQMGMTLPTTSPPIRIAEEYAMLDCISGERLVAGLPLGSPMDVNLAYGITPMEHRGAESGGRRAGDEGLAGEGDLPVERQVRPAWDGEPVARSI
jgi:Luciferase-like monooxygenase